MNAMPSVRSGLWQGKQLRVLYFKCPISWDLDHVYKKALRNVNTTKFLSLYIVFTRYHILTSRVFFLHTGNYMGILMAYPHMIC